MHFKSKTTILGEALTDWQGRGLLDHATAERLRNDLDRDGRGFGFQGFMITTGVICLCFAAMTFVAANWEDMSRLMRLSLVILGLWAAWGAALWAGLRGLERWHQGLMLLASGLFGAGIMLVSQIYHIQGNAADAVWLWGVGTLAAAAVTRGRMVLVLAIGLFALWHGMQLDALLRADAVNLPYLGWWLAGAGLALWQRNRFAAHVAVIALWFWLATALASVEPPLLALLLLAGLALGAIAALLASMSGARLLHGFEGAGLAYAALVLGTVMAVLALHHTDMGLHEMLDTDGSRGAWLLLLVCAAVPVVLALAGQIRGWALRHDLWVVVAMNAAVLVVHLLIRLPLLPEALLLAVFVWITRMGWRLDMRPLRVIGMGGFVLALLLVYGVTVGTLIGTSGFYLGAGVVLLGGAWVATRLDPKRGAGS